MTSWNCGFYQLDLEARPLIMGVLNVTPDSFSDHYSQLEEALAQAKTLQEDGADIIDVGGESTRPGSQGVSADEELSRILPVIERLAQTVNLPISVDTQKPEVARRALEAGASIINHVSSTLDYQAMLPVLQSTRAGYICMHMHQRPEVMQEKPSYEELIPDITRSLRQVNDACMEAGIDKDRLLFDPGIGFGKTLADNLEIFKSLVHLRQHMGRPLLMGISRKSWMTHLLGTPRENIPELDAYTVTVSTMLPFPEVAIHRVHNVKWLKNALELKQKIGS